jgi:hypothetical protein
LTGVTVTTGARWVVSAEVSFFEESATQPARRIGRRDSERRRSERGEAGGGRRRSGRREAGGERRELRGRVEEMSIGVVANVEDCAFKS